MKLQLSKLKPNPFKKEINGGKLDENTISKIQSNLKELGLMGSLPVFKKNNQYFLIAGHHRVEAMKREFGKNYEILVDVKDYSEDQILRGMVIENLTQRDNEYREEEANVLMVRNYLTKNKILLDGEGIIRPTGGQMKSQREDERGGRTDEFGSIRQIALWIDKDKGDVMKRSKIGNLIAVYEKLSPELLKKIEKTGGGKAPDNVVTVKQASEIVRTTTDPKEQKVLWEAMKKEEGRPHQLLSDYKNAPEEVKEQVRNGAVKLSDVNLAITQYNLREKKKDNISVVDISKKIDILIDRFSFSVSDVETKLRGTLKDIVVISKYVNDMSEKQRARINVKLDKFSETLGKLSKLIKEVSNRLENEEI